MKVVYKKRQIFYPVCFVIAVIMSAVCLKVWNGRANIVSKAVNFAVSPLQSVSDSICDSISEIGGYFRNQKKLLEENESLKKENAELKKLESRNMLLKNQNDNLYGYLGLKRERTDFELVNAQIIARTSSNYTSSFVIDKGTFHGVKEDMPIIDSDGNLLGVTVSADATSTKCLSVLSYDVNVGVYDERTGNTGVMSGDFDAFSSGKCMIKGLVSQTDIKEGDGILTSGLGDVYPRGLTVGKVESIIPDMNSYTLSAVVVPESTQLEADDIMVITGFERVYE